VAGCPAYKKRLQSMNEFRRHLAINNSDTYLTLHWRLRKFSLRPGTMDFVTYVSECQWARLLLDHLETRDRDLAIDGVRLDKLEDHAFRRMLSITQGRHTAFNWLLGFEPV
jgi:hypothetical protein